MKEEICHKLERLKGYVEELRNLRGLTRAELENKPVERAAVERFFQVSIESVIDICSMIISYEGLEKPDEYRKMISALDEVEVLDADFARDFSQVAGFRNVLVHQYAQVNLDLMYRFLQNRLSDFDAFAQAVAQYLDKES